MKWELGIWVHDNRKRLRWSQDTLADKVGVTKSYISKIETSTEPMEVSRGVLDKLAQTFGLRVFDAYDAAGYLPASETAQSDEQFFVFAMKRGAASPITQITDPELLAAIKKAITDKLTTE